MNAKYTGIGLKLGIWAASKPRESTLANGSTLTIWTRLPASILGGFHAAQIPSLSPIAVYLFRMVFVMGLALFSSLQAKEVETSLEESLALRRISEYWKEKDDSAVKVQIRNFLSNNPKSSYADQLYAMLGDLYFQEKNYLDALACYEEIRDKQFRIKTQFHYLHSLYETGKLEQFVHESDLFLKDPNAKAEQMNTIRFELAESYFCLAHAQENEENKTELLKKALCQYLPLIETKYCDMTLRQQAQIYAFLQEAPKAASLYLLLAQKECAKKEDWLFQAALQQLHFDTKAAIETFESIVEMQGKNVSQAAFNHLSLLFQEKRYKDFILAQDKSLKHVSKDKLPLIRYYLGKSLLRTQDFSKAIDPLLDSLASKTLDRLQEKSALLSLVACAKEMKDLDLFEKALVRMKSEFTEEPETLNALLMHSDLCRDQKEWTKAREDIKEVLRRSPPHPQREALVYDHALMFVQEEKWQEAALAFETFLEEFAQSAQKINAMRHALSSRLEDLKHASSQTQKVKKELLLQSLNLALAEKGAFSFSQKQKMRYLLGKTQYELSQYTEAIGTLSEYVREYQKDSSCADAYLLIAYCYRQGLEDETHFVLNSEKALSHNPNLQGAIDLHLALFNAYLELAGKAIDDEKPEVISKAAGHLFLALDKPVQIENRRWLAAYYFQQYQNGWEEAGERAIIVLEKLLGIKPGAIDLRLQAQNLDMEGEALKLASAYQKTGRNKERIYLLEALFREQSFQPDLKWKYQRMTQFELGKAYVDLGEKEKAVKIFSELISSSTHISSYFAIAAEVERAKLEFSMLKSMDRREGSEAVMAICDALKNAQIKRKLHSEPLHLEAALCYVDIKTEFAPPEEKANRRGVLLAQMKENFTSESDPLVSQYLSAAAQFPDKERLYKQYLAYIDAEVFRLDAEKNHLPAQIKEAKNKFNQLLAESTDDTLTERIRKSAEALQ
jgi:TolA-binding protein